MDIMIEKNVKQIKTRINDICLASKRNVDDIKLIAVSKTNAMEAILRVTKCGVIDFGENKAQELKQKAPEGPNHLNWHFIGHLQSNKVRDVVPHSYLIHSVDSIKLAKEIDKRARNIDKVQNVLLEINTSGEFSKFGLESYSNIFDLAKQCKDLPNLNLIGLMTMAPYTDDKIIIRNSFKSLKNIFIKLNDEGFKLSELSMGMTNDYEIAIQEGATLLRIGTAIFGNRN